MYLTASGWSSKNLTIIPIKPTGMGFLKFYLHCFICLCVGYCCALVRLFDYYQYYWYYSFISSQNIQNKTHANISNYHKVWSTSMVPYCCSLSCFYQKSRQLWSPSNKTVHEQIWTNLFLYTFIHFLLEIYAWLMIQNQWVYCHL